MQEKTQELSQVVEKALRSERPLSVLEISGFDEEYGTLISAWLESAPKSGAGRQARIDRVDLADSLLPAEGSAEKIENKKGGVYNNIYKSDFLSRPDAMEEYDMIVIFHLFENMAGDDAKALLESLLTKTKKQILVITPEYPYDLNTDDGISGIRTYHPVFFMGMDFSYKMLSTPEGAMQAYSFFPVVDYETLPCDMYAEPSDQGKKLKIAYILPTHTLTGGMKALLQQIKELTGNGHTVKVYYRSDAVERAIPEWSHLTDSDVSSQTVIPADARYLDHVKDVDIIVIAWMQQIQEFRDSKIPVVLWEQGSPFLFGDYGDLVHSEALEHVYMHKVYRAPVHLLAVSDAMRKIMKGMFNRESQLFPNGIDTDFYHPNENKNNDIPVVLLVGPPPSKFKGFEFALRALEAVNQIGIAFKVWWASPVVVLVENVTFEVEKFINPTQEMLAELFRNADVLLSTSLYESFALPPLEAMASGTAVIATDNGGINTYAKPGRNCLLCEQGDLESVFFALQHLLLNPGARKALAAAGRETALEYSFGNIVPRLEQCLRNILAQRI